MPQCGRPVSIPAHVAPRGLSSLGRKKAMKLDTMNLVLVRARFISLVLFLSNTKQDRMKAATRASSKDQSESVRQAAFTSGNLPSIIGARQSDASCHS